MARPRQSAKILELKGAFKHDPQRKRKSTPKPNKGLPNKPPAHLSTNEKKTWKEIYRLIPKGVVFENDGPIVEMTAILLTEFRKRKTDMPSAYLTRLSTCLDKLGMSPSGRESLTVPGSDQKPESGYDDFL